MGLFCFTDSETKEDLCQAVIGNMRMFEDHPTCIYLLETAEMYIQKLKVIGQEAKDEAKARDDAYYAKIDTYPLCVNCENFKFRAREDIDVTENKYGMYCDEVSFEDWVIQLGKRTPHFDNGGELCPEFKWAEGKGGKVQVNSLKN